MKEMQASHHETKQANLNDLPDRSLETGPLYRLHHARWALLAMGLGLFWIIQQTDQQYWRGIAVMSECSSQIQRNEIGAVVIFYIGVPQEMTQS